MFLMMARRLRQAGLSRYEWKCDSLNAPSRAAALRYGFRYEGLFRQATVYKGRNRDTRGSPSPTRVAGGQGGVRALARSGELRCRGSKRAPLAARAAD